MGSTRMGRPMIVQVHDITAVCRQCGGTNFQPLTRRTAALAERAALHRMRREDALPHTS